jgi:hypothetical protein
VRDRRDAEKVTLTAISPSIPAFAAVVIYPVTSVAGQDFFAQLDG